MTEAASNTCKMQYVRLGKTGLKVSRLALGCMSYGTSKWQKWVLDEEESLKMIKKAYDAGINFWDTANVYSNGESEKVVGKAIKHFNIPRENLVIATKVHGFVHPDVSVRLQDDPEDHYFINQRGQSRKHIMDSIDASLKRLQLDYVDLYQIHRWDYNTPIEETMEALHDVVKSGKARYIGASSMHAWQFAKAQHVAEKNGWTKFVSMQDLYNLIYREEERDMIPMCVDQGVGIIPWSPLARGVLTGKDRNTTRAETDLNTKKWFGQERDEAMTAAIVDKVVEIADKKGCTPAQISLAWVLSKDYISAPILGISSEKHLNDLIGALEVKLTPEEIEALEEIYAPRKIAGFV
ncbi:hypothetical protein BZG36_03482 [Bifiguratus adelaidae]|uniref:NADP-dependent oxidoreductase domain-containing protein n=1 Tax=Bifiguratus adelaidae TaxID=1938954 RepID=A0A261XWN8_9FUNG|nr:hypothetical protein BZG36_03482 [Bifiguratus adelaidae]